MMCNGNFHHQKTIKYKQMKRIYLVLLVLFLGFTIKVSSQETTTLLTGTWAFDFNASIQEMDTASKMNLDTIDTVRRVRLEQSYIGRIVIFSDNGNYQQTLSNGHTASGTWILSDDKQYIVITDPNGNKHTQQIRSISTTKLVLKPILESNVKMIIPEWSFVKS